MCLVSVVWKITFSTENSGMEGLGAHFTFNLFINFYLFMKVCCNYAGLCIILSGKMHRHIKPFGVYFEIL